MTDVPPPPPPQTAMATAAEEEDSSNYDVTGVNISMKWSKQTFEFNFPIVLNDTDGTGSTGRHTTGLDLKQQVYKLTKVPVERQKILLSGKSSKLKFWKGPLLDDFDLATITTVMSNAVPDNNHQQQHPLSLTLLGSAEVLQEEKVKKDVTSTEEGKIPTKFIEDMSPSERKDYRRKMLQQVLSARPGGYIPAVQYSPLDSDAAVDAPGFRQTYDGEVISYNRLVNGFSQHQIEKLLSSNQTGGNDAATQAKESEETSTLHGKVVMTMGLELQRAYVNDIDVLAPSTTSTLGDDSGDSDDECGGTILTGAENGHVQLWRNCQRVADVIHEGPFRPNDADSGVNSVLALSQVLQDTTVGKQVAMAHNTFPSFATAGRCTVRLWTSDAECIAAIPAGPQMPQVSPTSLVQLPFASLNEDGCGMLCIAARYDVIMPPPGGPRQHITPQDEAGRQRLAYIQAQEQALVETLERWKRSIQIWYYFYDTNSNQNNEGVMSASGPSPSKSLSIQTAILELSAPSLSHGPSPSPAVSSIVSWPDPVRSGNEILVAGDSWGRIHVWSVSFHSGNGDDQQQPIQISPLTSLHLKVVDQATISSSPRSCEISCLKYDRVYHRLIVSTSATTTSPTFDSTTAITTTTIPVAQAVYIFDIKSMSNDDHGHTIINPRPHLCLNGHKDVVQNILPLPNGDIITAGGKMDATLQVWSHVDQLSPLQEGDHNTSSSDNIQRSIKILTTASNPNLAADDKVGYVFSLSVLSNAKEGSQNFAIAAARYNVVKVIL